ncbi:MAG TPA: hypothetical protein VFN48_09100 [Solirubrobacteraceae bacterium]|nr:hypothetical protein [Solirubrobacteraceae bacterium]
MSASASSAPPDSLRRRIFATVIFLSLGPVIYVQRDLRRRSRQEVRGPKLLWRIGSTNALVAVAYLRWGRRIQED